MAGAGVITSNNIEVDGNSEPTTNHAADGDDLDDDLDDDPNSLLLLRRLSFPRDSGCFTNSANSSANSSSASSGVVLPPHHHHHPRPSPTASERSSSSSLSSSSQPESGIGMVTRGNKTKLTKKTAELATPEESKLALDGSEFSPQSILLACI